MIQNIHFSGKEHQGSRNYQEDYYAFFPFPLPDGSNGLLVVLADGMGGHQAGDVASRVAVNAFIQTFRDVSGSIKDRLSSGLFTGNQAIKDVLASAEDPSCLEGMGTTLVAVAIANKTVEFVSIGDSPLYLSRPNQLVRLNEDHSMAVVFGGKVHNGELTEEEAQSHPDRNSLRAALMGDPLTLVDSSDQPIELKPNETLVLASDGIGTLSEEDLQTALCAHQSNSALETVQALINDVLKLEKTKQDNVTICVFKLPSEES